MSEDKKNKNEPLSVYISKLTDQELKILLLKLKNEVKKPDASWNDIKSILRQISKKNSEIPKEIIHFILNN